MLTAVSDARLAYRDLILVLAIAAIVISLIAQGLTLGPLVRLAGIAQPGDARREEATARLRLAQAALTRLDELAEEAVAAGDQATDDAIDRARTTLEARIDRARARVDDDRAGDRSEPATGRQANRELRRALTSADHPDMARLYDDAAISQA